MNAKKELFPHRTMPADLKRADGSLLRPLVGDIEAMMQRAREARIEDQGTVYDAADQYLQHAVDIHNNLYLSAYKNDPKLLERIVEWQSLIREDRRVEERLSRILRNTGLLSSDPFQSQGEKIDSASKLHEENPTAGGDDKYAWVSMAYCYWIIAIYSFTSRHLLEYQVSCLASNSGSYLQSGWTVARPTSFQVSTSSQSFPRASDPLTLPSTRTPRPRKYIVLFGSCFFFYS